MVVYLFTAWEKWESKGGEYMLSSRCMNAFITDKCEKIAEKLSDQSKDKVIFVTVQTEKDSFLVRFRYYYPKKFFTSLKRYSVNFNIRRSHYYRDLEILEDRMTTVEKIWAKKNK